MSESEIRLKVISEIMKLTISSYSSIESFRAAAIKEIASNTTSQIISTETK